MTRKLTALFWLTLSFLLVGCVSRLPKERPSDVRISYSFNGGMMNYGENISISADESWRRISNEMVRFEVHYQLAEAELDALYATFRENKIDRIRSREEMVYDRGGDSVSISYGEELYRASDSGLNFVTARWQDEFSRLVTAVNQAAGETTSSPQATFTIQLDSSIQPLNLTVQVQMGDAFLGLISDISTSELFQIKTSDGNGRFPISIWNDNSELVASSEIDLSSSQGVLLKVEDGNVLFVPLP
ncbi:MAG: hypothetical protein GY805_01160 [Chloroflexi bacterium]|nr:hypothetical protein [Chloroflexota bacterium]